MVATRIVRSSVLRSFLWVFTTYARIWIWNDNFLNTPATASSWTLILPKARAAWMWSILWSLHYWKLVWKTTHIITNQTHHSQITWHPFSLSAVNNFTFFFKTKEPLFMEYPWASSRALIQRVPMLRVHILRVLHLRKYTFQCVVHFGAGEDVTVSFLDWHHLCHQTPHMLVKLYLLHIHLLLLMMVQIVKDFIAHLDLLPVVFIYKDWAFLLCFQIILFDDAVYLPINFV